jgi:Fe-S-cluster-containing dehydrogenase component
MLGNDGAGAGGAYAGHRHRRQADRRQSCIGCKACQVACMQWNDLRDEVGETTGTYDNPIDLTPQSWTVMRFSGVREGPTATSNG